MLQTTFEIVSMNAGMNEWHMRPNQSILFWQKLETCWPWDHAVICRQSHLHHSYWPRSRICPSSTSNTAWTLSLPTYFIFKMDSDFTGNISNKDNWETMQKPQNTINMNNESSWKLKIGAYYRLSWSG